MKQVIKKMLAACSVCASFLVGHQVFASPPTDGLTEYSDTYTVQKPYNLPVSDRFSAVNGVYTCWIYHTDKPFSAGSGTGPRTEMRWASNWSTGRRAWEADVLIQSGSNSTCVMQIKTNGGFEPIYVDVKNTNNGTLYNDNNSTVVTSGVYGQWVHIATDYNTATGVGHIYINGVLKLTRTQKLSETWYFKNGVYNTTNYSKATFKNIKMWK